MYCNHEYVEDLKNQRELQKHICEHGETIFHNECGGGYNKISIKIIDCDGKKYFLAENWAGAVIEIRAI